MNDATNVIELRRSQQDLDQFNQIVLSILEHQQRILVVKGIGLRPDEFTRVRQNLEEMRRVWVEHNAELEAPITLKAPLGLSQSQSEAIAKILREAFSHGMARMEAVALGERVIHEILCVRGTL